MSPCESRKRPTTSGQEALFFVVAVVVAVVLRLAVSLKVADVISW
jgi:hypothetical protein